MKFKKGQKVIVTSVSGTLVTDEEFEEVWVEVFSRKVEKGAGIITMIDENSHHCYGVTFNQEDGRVWLAESEIKSVGNILNV